MNAQLLTNCDESVQADFPDAQQLCHSPQDLRTLDAGTHVSRYLILQLLGEGGIGIVYEAFDPKLNRKIALKFLRPIETVSQESFQSAQTRLLAEAQSLARISHPNIVAIFDVGTFQDNVFLAMELAHGDTFLKWIKHKQPKAVEIVRKLCLVGEGLAAAHQIGIVHQDIKPGNIIVSPDGTVRLLDFGLASPTASFPLENTKESESTRIHAHSRPKFSPPSLVLVPDSTTNGERYSTHHSKQRVMGTPSYMSPEQHRGEGVDHYSDQFSFCVTMWESLFGVCPFYGESLQVLEQAKLSTALQFPPRIRRQSKKLIEVLSKGLCPNPSCRYPNMSSLLAELDAWLHPRNNFLFFFTAISTTVLIFVAFFFVHLNGFHLSSSDSCQIGRKSFDDFWNPRTKTQIHTSFVSTQLDYADDSWRKIQYLLEDRVHSWNRSYQEACNNLHEKSVFYLDTDQRISCLRNRMEETRSFVETLKNADINIVQNSVQLLQGLSSMEDCNNEEDLEFQLPLPAIPELARQVSRIRDQLSELNILAFAGRNTGIESKFVATIEKARIVGFLPLLAEANYDYGYALSKMGRARSSQFHLEQAISIAEQCKYEYILLRAATRIIYVQSYLLGDSLSYASLFEHARAHLHRTGNDALDRASLMHDSSGPLMIQNNIDAAYQAISETVEIYSNILGHRNMATIFAIRDFAVISESRGEVENSERLYRLAIANTESLLGPNHPELALPRHNLIRLLIQQSRFSEANTLLEQTVESLQELQSPNNLARILYAQSRTALDETYGKHSSAIQHSRELIRLNRELLGSNNSKNSSYGWVQLQLIRLLLKIGLLDEAQRNVDELLENIDSIHPNEQAHLIRTELHVFSARIAILRSNWNIAEEHLHLATIPKKKRTPLNAQSAAQVDLLLGIVERHHMHLEQAAQLHAEALEDGKRYLGRGNTQLQEFYTELARSLILRKRFVEAENHLNTIQSSLEQAFGPDNPRLYDVWDTLGDLNLAQNNIAEAEMAWKKAIERFDPENFNPRNLDSICIKYHTLNPREFNPKCAISEFPQ